MKHKPLKTMVGKKTKVIWENYKEVLDELKATETGVQNTVVAAKKEKTAKAVSTAKNVNVQTIESTVQALVDSLTNAKAEFNDVEAAIEAKKAELQEIHQLEVEANALVAVVATKDKLVAERQETAKKTLDDAAEKAQEVQQEAETKVAEMLRAAKEADGKAVVARKRQEEEWEYNFSRLKKERLDRLQDDLNAKIKVVEEREEEVTNREAKAKELDTEVTNLKDQIQQLEAATEQKVVAAVEKAKAGVAQSNAIAKAMDKKGHEAEMSIVNAKVASLEATVTDLNKRLEKANRDVQTANEKVAEMAQKALQAGADAKTVAELHRVTALGNKK
jgi:DNA repair exonuclease SbcCD ATPase subunit